MTMTSDMDITSPTVIASPIASTSSFGPYISFSDGDTRILSSDGVSFRVDSLILHRHAPDFGHAIDSLKFTKKQTLTGIVLPETADTLNLIIRSIYSVPSTSTPPHFSDAEGAVNLLLAIDKYQLNLVDTDLEQFASEYVGNLEPPFRAYCLAVRSKSPLARDIAIRRFVVQDGGIADVLPPWIREVEYVDAADVLRLQYLKRDAVARASKILNEHIVAGVCDMHRRLRLRKPIKSLPFMPGFHLRSEHLSAYMTSLTGCASEKGGSCSQRFANEKVLESIGERVKRDHAALLDSVVRAEASGYHKIGL